MRVDHLDSLSTISFSHHPFLMFHPHGKAKKKPSGISFMKVAFNSFYLFFNHFCIYTNIIRNSFLQAIFCSCLFHWLISLPCSVSLIHTFHNHSIIVIRLRPNLLPLPTFVPL
jgi:hypothetical protein